MPSPSTIHPSHIIDAHCYGHIETHEYFTGLEEGAPEPMADQVYVALDMEGYDSIS